ncbi:MAG: hypothetical protein ACLUSV_08615 [Streptococcus sp.]
MKSQQGWDAINPDEHLKMKILWFNNVKGEPMVSSNGNNLNPTAYWFAQPTVVVPELPEDKLVLPNTVLHQLLCKNFVSRRNN